MADSEGLAMITLATTRGLGDDAPMHALSWVIPASIAPEFARITTERFGQPIEAVGTVADMARTYEQNRAIYITDGDQLPEGQ